jgi:hypothetical protein
MTAQSALDCSFESEAEDILQSKFRTRGEAEERKEPGERKRAAGERKRASAYNS